MSSGTFSSIKNTDQTYIPFPETIIGTGKVYRSAIPSSLELDYLQNKLKIQTIVQLCLDEEFKFSGKTRTLKRYNEMEFTVIKFPIRDFQVPKSKEDTRKLIDTILNTTHEGNNVLIHCMAGRGRTGLILACMAKKILKMESEQAIEWVRQYIPNAVETSDQKEFVANCFLMEEEEPAPALLALTLKEDSADEGLELPKEATGVIAPTVTDDLAPTAKVPSTNPHATINLGDLTPGSQVEEIGVAPKTEKKRSCCIVQ